MIQLRWKRLYYRWLQTYNRIHNISSRASSSVCFSGFVPRPRTSYFLDIMVLNFTSGSIGMMILFFHLAGTILYRLLTNTNLSIREWSNQTIVIYNFIRAAGAIYYDGERSKPEETIGEQCTIHSIDVLNLGWFTDLSLIQDRQF